MTQERGVGEVLRELVHEQFFKDMARVAFLGLPLTAIGATVAVVEASKGNVLAASAGVLIFGVGVSQIYVGGKIGY